MKSLRIHSVDRVRCSAVSMHSLRARPEEDILEVFKTFEGAVKKTKSIPMRVILFESTFPRALATFSHV